jgi:Tfp pilus assembly protein PilF
VTRLGALPNIVVRPTSSVRRFGGDEDPIAAGRELQVDAVLDGHVQHDGDRLRVTLQLINVATGRPMWSDSVDERFTDVFAVEDAVSERVASALVPVLSGEVRRRLVKRYTNNEEAYSAYLAGRVEADKLTRAGSLKAIDHFKRAVELDPMYALAWAGLADAYIWFCIDQGPPRELLPQAEMAARRAVELDDSLADAHGSLAMIAYRYDYDWPRAEREFRRALEIDAHDGSLRQKYGWYLSMLGRTEDAQEQMRLAGQLDPLSLPIQIDLGLPDYSARRYDPSIVVAQRMLAAHPRFATGYFDLALAQIGAGRPHDALATLRRGTPFDDTPEVIAHTAIAHANLGDRSEAVSAIERLKQLSAQRYVSPATIGLVYTALGDRTSAFEWLEKGYEDRSWWMIFLRVDGRFDPLRRDARFATLLQKVGLS